MDISVGKFGKVVNGGWKMVESTKEEWERGVTLTQYFGGFNSRWPVSEFQLMTTHLYYIGVPTILWSIRNNQHQRDVLLLGVIVINASGCDHQFVWIIILSMSSFRRIAATVETHRRMWIIIFSMSSFRRDRYLEYGLISTCLGDSWTPPKKNCAIWNLS